MGIERIFFVTVLLILYRIDGVQFFHTGETDTEYPSDSLKDETGFYPLGGSVPPVRCHHSVAYTHEKVVVFGGISTSGALMDDVHVYDTRQQRWSGAIHRRVRANNGGEIIDLLGNHVLEPLHDVRTGVHRLPTAQTGFEGDSPAKRAEHRAVVMDGLMYVFGGFGGEGGRYGILNDLYSFDTQRLVWKCLDASSGHVPSRRAGHVMVADPEPSPAKGGGQGRFLYVVGGRGESKSGADDTDMVALGDVWRYDVTSHHWTQLDAHSTQHPPGRQHAAGAILMDRIFIFGGIDPKSSYIYQDVWAFHTNTAQWQLLHATPSQVPQWDITPDTAVPGFAPPPLFSAHMLPVSQDSFLIYGGVGGGGACGDEGHCGRELTTLGQVYRFTVGFTARTVSDGQYRIDDVFDGHTEDASFSSKRSVDPPGLGDFTPSVGSRPGIASADLDPLLCSWNHSRLSGAEANRGRRRKTYALEEVVLSDRGFLYEFGGLAAVSGEPLTAGQTATSLYLPLSLDGGGSIVYKAYDAESGEQLRTVVDPIANGAWSHQDGYTHAMPVPRPGTDDARADVVFVGGFKQHSVTPRDVVLISGTDANL